jgi:hypothetical protein
MAALQAMKGRGFSLEHPSLQDLRAATAGSPCPDPEGLIGRIITDHLEEVAWEVLRAARRETANQALVDHLACRLLPLAEKARQQRLAHWHLDTRHLLVRFSFIKEGAAVSFDDGDIQAIFLQAFRLEGLLIALDFGKRQRPLLTTGLPLPADVGGLAESMDAVLSREPGADPPALMARLNRRLPEGLHIHLWQVLPDFASPVGVLALSSHWRWAVPSEYRVQVQRRVISFLGASAWPWDRGPSKAEATVDLRRLIHKMYWEDDALCFTTGMGTFQAINPIKMLGAVLGLEPGNLAGLVRTHVNLKPDLRLAQAERFEPKLKNIYEDAVLLGGGSNIILVDEDDDEPILLG